MSDLRELLDRWDAEGPSRALADQLAAHSPEPLVCVLCGWGWMSVSNRCLNPDCRGFCTWGHEQGGDPSSWVREGDGWRPRMPGESP